MGIIALSTLCQGQSALTDAQVTAAINHASGKRHQVGLALNDLQTNLLSWSCLYDMQNNCGTPSSFTHLKAGLSYRLFKLAARCCLSASIALRQEMRLPYIHIMASPSRPEYLDAGGMGMASSVHRIVIFQH